MTEQAYQLCVATRKDGRPCRAIGRVFDSARNGLVCDAHQPGGPGRESLKRGTMLLAMKDIAEDAAEDARRRDALAVGLSDDGLRTLLNELRKFREGRPLQAKVYNILVDLLTEDRQRKPGRRRVFPA
jgi:hypothetical protein